MPQEPWNAEEDELLYQLVQRLGPSSWSETARLLNSTLNVNRLAKQCRERWISHVDPRIRRGDWSLSEDRFILNQQNLWGNRWADIARHLPGRTTHAVKNRYHQLQRLLNQGKTKLETILNAPLIHVVPHFLQQTNNFKDNLGKDVEFGNQLKVKKTIIKKKREAVSNYKCFSEIDSLDQLKKNMQVYSEHEAKYVPNEIMDQDNLMICAQPVENHSNFEQIGEIEESIKNCEAHREEIQPIETVCRAVHSNPEIELSPRKFTRTFLEFQQSPPGVLLASDVGIYPVTPTFTEHCSSCNESRVIEPSTCETNQENEYISKSEFLTPSSELSESLSNKCIQSICTFNEDPSIYNEIEYRDPNWYGWSEHPNDWDSNPMHRLDTGSIDDPFLYSFPEM
ncbi:putative myb proto-oncogene protein [Cryptosporidium canis]|uniref:Myb proto-oncogene protein n=1 Tax=Cryptosporidium canis TaxID=195482 RepID=A0ABQ8P9G7_9CRYT|nr:putative myb proto-oncogene protein [Cryptosporidium canis]KAJ1613552.1 putative myb proto-oncogene protein [Cryptosporidium canis]